MPNDRVQRIKLTVLDLRTANAAVRRLPAEQQIDITQEHTPDAHLNVQWGEQPDEWAVVHHGEILRHE
jgi:hypothetical protein